MDGQTQSFSAQQPCAPLRNWAIALVITTIVVIASDLWLDQPIAFFIHQNVVDKTIFVWLQRFPVVFLWLSLIVLAWCGLWALINRPFSRLQSVGLACNISFIAANFVNNQLKYTFGRTWPDTWIENNPSLIQNGVFGFNPFHGGPGFASFPSGHVAAMCAVLASSLVVVCKLAPDLYCLRSRGCNRGDWRELSFFERCCWRNLCRHNRRLLNEENGAFKNGSVRMEAWFLRLRTKVISFHARVIFPNLHPNSTMRIALIFAYQSEAEKSDGRGEDCFGRTFESAAGRQGKPVQLQFCASMMEVRVIAPVCASSCRLT